MNDENLNLKVGLKGAEEAGSKMDNFRKKFAANAEEASRFGEKLQKAGLAIGAVGAGLTAYSKSATDSTVAYVKSVMSISRVTGDSVEQTSRLQYVFQRSGIAAGQASQVFGVFSKNITSTNESLRDSASQQQEYNNKIEAARIKIKSLTEEQKKNGDATGAIRNQIESLNISIAGYEKAMGAAVTPLQKIGVATLDANGKTRAFSEILLDVSDKFKEMPNGADKTTLAMQLFGRSGKDLIPILSKGRDGITDLMNQADKLGLTLTGNNVDAVLKYTEAQKKLKDAQQSFTVSVGNQAIPMWQKLADIQLQAVATYEALPGPIKNAITATLAFGGPILTAVGGLSAFIGNLVQAKPAVDGFSKAIGGLGRGFGWVAVISIAVVALTTLEQKTQFFTRSFQAIQTKLQPVVSWLQANVFPVFQQIGSFIAGQFAAAWRDLSEAFNRVAQALAPFRPQLEFLAMVFGVVLMAPLIAFTVALVALIAVVTGIVTIVARVIGWLAQWFSMLAAGASQVAQFAGQVGSSIGNMARGAGEKINQIIDFFRSLPGRILAAVGDLGNLLYNAGKSILDGLGRGIQEAANVPKKAMEGALQKIKNLLPHSPAKEGPFSGRGWTLYSGMTIPEALADGITKSAPKAYASMQNAMKSIRSAVTVPVSAALRSTGVTGSLTSASSGSTRDAVAAPSQQGGGVTVQINVHGNLIGGDDASLRGLGVKLAQLTEQALRGQGVDNVTQLRVSP